MIAIEHQSSPYSVLTTWVFLGQLLSFQKYWEIITIQWIISDPSRHDNEPSSTLRTIKFYSDIVCHYALAALMKAYGWGRSEGTLTRGHN